MFIVPRGADEAQQSLLVRVLHQPAKEEMAIACIGIFASRCLGKLAPIGREECMERRLLLGGSESARRAEISECEREDGPLAANVGSRGRVGRAERDGVGVEAIVRVECSRQLKHEGGRGRRSVVENGRPVVAFGPSGLRITDGREGFLVPAHRPNSRSLAGDLLGRDPLFGKRSESVHQLGKIRQLANASEFPSSAREDPAAVRKTCRDVRVRQLARREQEPAVGFQPQHFVESKATLQWVRRQGLRLETQLPCGIVLRGALLAVPLVVPQLSLAPTPGIDTHRRAGGEEEEGDEDRDAFHEGVLHGNAS